jgi:hypothetical protein
MAGADRAVAGGLSELVRNTVEGGHRLRWKADTRMVIADT